MRLSRSSDSDPSFLALPENTYINDTADNENEEDQEDREEQFLFDLDNNAAHDEEAVDDGGEDEEALDNSNGDLGDNNNTEHGPIYVQSATSGEKWELSWPIWHMLPRNERRAIAAKHGYKTIGEFEEYMSLTRAVDESEGRVQERSGIITLPSPIGLENENIEYIGRVPQQVAATSIADSEAFENNDWHTPYTNLLNIEDDDDSTVSPAEEDSNNVLSKTQTSEHEHIDLDIHIENIRKGGLPCQLADEILHKCFSYLSVDDHAPLALVSPHWSRFTRCESLYKALCERVYLNQSKRKALHISRFGSYRNMLEQRPRVRTGGGVYVLKYQEVRKIQRDMWTEIPLGAVLESVYFRYLYFFEDGRVMYALTHATPLEMIPRFKRMLIYGYGSKDKWGVWGNYQLRKDEVVVKVSQDWHDVCFHLRVIPSNSALHYDSGDRGMYTTIELEKHMSSEMGNFDEENSHDLVNYEIPTSTYFRYLRDKRL
jgi:F-box protein 9